MQEARSHTGGHHKGSDTSPQVCLPSGQACALLGQRKMLSGRVSWLWSPSQGKLLVTLALGHVGVRSARRAWVCSRVYRIW